MNKRTASLLSLAAGVGLGLGLAPWLPGGANNPDDTDGDSPRYSSKSPRATLRGHPGGHPRSGGAKSPGDGTSHSPTLSTLLGLTTTHNGSSHDADFYLQIQRLSAGDISLLLEELGTGPQHDPRTYKVRASLICQWARIDPDGAWAAAINNPNIHLRGQAISAVISEIASTDLAKARDLAAVASGSDKQSALSSLVSIMSRDDPEGALRLLEDGFGPNQQHGHLHGIFQSWTRRNPDAAIARFRKMTGPQALQRAGGAIATALAASDPERAVRFANSIKNWNARSHALNSAIRVIAFEDPQRAIAHLEGLPKGSNRTGMLSAIATSWMARDADGAMAWLHSLEPAERSRAVNEGMWQFIHADAGKTAELLATLPSSNQSAHQYMSVASQWAQQDPEAAAAWVKTLPAGNGRIRAMSGLVSVLATTDPGEAARLIESEGLHRQQSHQVAGIVANWMETDRAAALGWMDGLDVTPDVRRQIISSTISQWAQRDVEGAAGQALSYVDEDERRSAVQALVGGWGASDPQGAREWIGKELDGPEQRAALGTLIQRVSQQDAESAADMFIEATASLSAGELKESFRDVPSQIAGSWAQHDPAGAGEWVRSLPEGESRAEAVQQLVDSWGDHDVEGAANFVLTLDDGSERDRAVERLVHDVKRTDPESAFAWAASLGDERTRERMILDTAHTWKMNDPDAARDAVQSADISDKAKTRVLDHLGR